MAEVVQYLIVHGDDTGHVPEGAWQWPPGPCTSPWCLILIDTAVPCQRPTDLVIVASLSHVARRIRLGTVLWPKLVTHTTWTWRATKATWLTTDLKKPRETWQRLDTGDLRHALQYDLLRVAWKLLPHPEKLGDMRPPPKDLLVPRIVSKDKGLVRLPPTGQLVFQLVQTFGIIDPAPVGPGAYALLRLHEDEVKRDGGTPLVLPSTSECTAAIKKGADHWIKEALEWL